MRLHAFGTLIFVLTATAAAAAADTGTTVCSNPGLSATDQSNCRDQMNAAATPAARDQVRRDYAARTVSTTSPPATESLPAGLPPTTSPPTLPDAAATPPVPRPTVSKPPQ